MREFRYFTCTILIGFGFFYLLRSIDFPLFQPYYSWATLSIILGLAFLLQSRFGGQADFLLPGVFFTGYGLHQYIAGKLAYWPGEQVVIFLLFGLGFLLIYLKKGVGKGAGILFIIISALLIFYEKILDFLGISNYAETVSTYWPVALILIGLYILYKKK